MTPEQQRQFDALPDWARAKVADDPDDMSDPVKHSLAFVVWAVYSGFGHMHWLGKPKYLCSSCGRPTPETAPPDCRLPGWHYFPDLGIRYNRTKSQKGPRVYRLDKDGNRPACVGVGETAKEKRARLKREAEEWGTQTVINTEELTQEQVDALNDAMRSANVSDEDVKQLAAELKLGEATVKRWFDATNGGDFSPAIGADAVGKEDYLLQNNGEPDYDEYPQGPAAYQNDPYLDTGEHDYETEDTTEDDGITDPAESSLHDRLLIAALLSDEGYGREATFGVTFTGPLKTADTPVFPTLYSAVEYVNNVISGNVDAYSAMAWTSFKVAQNSQGLWLLDYEYHKKTDQDPSP